MQTNINKVLVYRLKYLIRAIQRTNNYVIPIRNHGDMIILKQELIGTIL
jgi:hypothetical protein